MFVWRGEKRGDEAADVDGLHLLLFQSQEAKHARNLGELLDQEAWTATLVVHLRQQTTLKLAVSTPSEGKAVTDLFNRQRNTITGSWTGSREPFCWLSATVFFFILFAPKY